MGKAYFEEYAALVKKGYKNISLAATSTSCALILESLSAQKSPLKDLSVIPKNIFLIDPIVKPAVSGAKAVALKVMSLLPYEYTLSIFTTVGPTQAFTPTEFSYWYANRPASTLQSLQDLTYLLVSRLKAKFTLPSDLNLYIYSSINDPTVDPEGSKLIVENVNGKVKRKEIDSKLHVFTRLSGRPEAKTVADLKQENATDDEYPPPIAFTAKDRENQKQIFEEMVEVMQKS